VLGVSATELIVVVVLTSRLSRLVDRVAIADSHDMRDASLSIRSNASTFEKCGFDSKLDNVRKRMSRKVG